MDPETQESLQCEETASQIPVENVQDRIEEYLRSKRTTWKSFEGDSTIPNRAAWGILVTFSRRTRVVFLSVLRLHDLLAAQRNGIFKIDRPVQLIV